MTRHDVTYEEFVLEAKRNNISVLLKETTTDVPEGMRHIYAPKGDRIAGCFSTYRGTWFKNPIKWYTNGRKFEKVYI